MPEERKLVTVLFADVTNSTSLGESLDPEDVRALMGRYYEHAREVIHGLGGTLEKFIGDAVMAVFGLPVAHGDDAERALAAALALREVTQKDPLLGESFLLRMGVNTGEVMATTDASRSDFLVSGDTVNVAARLEQSAEPGEIIASERTALAARMAFSFDEPREIQVKGKSLPLRIFPLIEKRATRLVERPPLIGRKQDLLQLEILRERTLEEERPQFISIIAPAGTGKARLLEEFLDRLDPAEGFRIARATCHSYGETMAYVPLQGLLSDLLDGDVSEERVVDTFVQGGYRSDDAARLTDHVLATLGHEGERGANADRELIFNAWRLLIECLSFQAPYVLIFENLHWASESLLDLVEHISALRAQTSLLLMALSRPELLDRRPGWGGGRQNFTSLALQPLSAKRSRELIKRLAPDLPNEVNEKIAESAGGNPFFVQEMVRGLAERGLAGQAATIGALPDTVHAAVLARLDVLSKTEREILQVASVVSRTFTPALFKRVLPAYSAEEIETALNGLLARDMLAPVAGGSFTFHHGLLLDITYGTLSRAERIRLHKAIAAALLEEADQPDDCAELLAHHYYKAVQLSKMSAVPQKLEIETERAIKFQVRAGELACRSGAFNEAVTYFENAIGLAGDAEKVELYEQLADSLTYGWKLKKRESYRSALDLWRTLPEHQPLLGARLTRKFLMTSMRLSFTDVLSQEEAEALRQEGMQLAEQAIDESELWWMRAIAGAIGYRTLNELSVEEMRQSTKVQELKKLTLEAANYFEQQQNWDALSEILDIYSGLQLRSGEHKEAVETTQQRLHLADLSFSERMDAIASIVSLDFLVGEYETACQIMAEALRNLRPGDPFEILGNIIGTAIWMQFLTGHWSEIDKFLPTLDEIRVRVQDIEGAGGPVANGYQALLVIALSRENQTEVEALQILLRELAPQFYKEEGELGIVSMYRDGDISQFKVGKRGDSVAGILMMLFTEHGHCPPDELMEQGNYYADDMSLRASNIAKALAANDNAALEQAIDEAEEHQLIVHAAHMRIALARRTGDKRHLERARPVLEQLEDRLFLRKLQEVEKLVQTS